MIVKNQKKIEKKSNCLFKRFGNGVHLLKDSDDKYCLLVLQNENVDALFIDDDLSVGFQSSVGGEITYTDFDNHYTYIKKLEADELEINLKEAIGK